MPKRVTEDENHQGVKRIFGVPTPYRGDEAVNKWYVDELVAAGGGGGGSNGIIDGGTPFTDYSGGPVIDCGGIT